MSQVSGVPRVTYAVRGKTINQWAWFWIEGLGGTLEKTGPDEFGNQRWEILMGDFVTDLVSAAEGTRSSKVKDFLKTFGDHSVMSIDYAVRKPLNDQIDVPGTPLGSHQGLNLVHQDQVNQRRGFSLLKRVDHVTYAVTPETIEEVAAFWLKELEGTLVLKNDDVRPDDPSDSMMLWGIVLNQGITAEELGIALVAGIDRDQVSQVTRFVQKKGPNIVQHVAYDVGEMASFRKYFEGEFGANLLSETLVVPDGFGGYVRQVFGRGYESGNAAEVGFPEFVERLSGSGKGFTNAAGEGLYEKVKRVSETGDDTPIVDFSRMPPDWEPPQPRISVPATSVPPR